MLRLNFYPSTYPRYSMDISGVIQDARMNNIPSFLNIKTKAASDIFFKGLSNWSSSYTIGQKRAETVRQLRDKLTTKQMPILNKAFETISEHESTLRSFWSEPTEMENEGYSQLLFRGEHTIPLNHIPQLLKVWSVLKIFIFPAMTVSTPLITFIAPFIVVKYVMKMPLTFKQYFAIAKKMYLGGGMTSLLGSMNISSPPALPYSLGEQARIWLQTGWVVISAVQSIMQPIQGAKHTYKLQNLILEKADAIRAYMNSFDIIRSEFLKVGIKINRVQIPADIFSDNRRLVAFALENPFIFRMIDKQIGTYEVWYRFALCPTITPVQWVYTSNNKPYICFKDICDIGISIDKQRCFNIQLGGEQSQQHALLTGPNRGGKSTALRAVLRNVLLGHTFGIAIGSAATMTTFDWVQSCLRLEDLPGKASLFEREVAFATASLSRGDANKGIVFVDELFHSTNPPDAAAASSYYLKKLWSQPLIASMISTHVFELIENLPAEKPVQQLCCPAEIRKDGSVDYKYGLARGICKVSSVQEILNEQGL